MIRGRRNAGESVKALFLESFSLHRVRFDALNLVTGRSQPFGERPNTRAEVDQIL